MVGHPFGSKASSVEEFIDGVELRPRHQPHLRDIRRPELLEAIKYGRREPANPGRDGRTRWRFTHKGVIYITDSSAKHEITSWRLDGEEEDLGATATSTNQTNSHTVLVVDNSGSMRKDDVSGYCSRTAAVYDTLARDFVEPQLRCKANLGEAVVSLIEMGNEATIVFEGHPLNEQLAFLLKRRAQCHAHSHGNYLPALDKVLELMRRDSTKKTQLFLLFLSDGAPSDHVFRECEHGVNVWQEDPFAMFRPRLKSKDKSPLTLCRFGGSRCRLNTSKLVHSECLDRIKKLGDIFGRDRTYIGTVAFGPADQDYTVLQEMAAQLPRSSFQKLGLSAKLLSTAFSSLTNSLTSLRSDASTTSPLTQRPVVMEKDTDVSDHQWDIYQRSKNTALSKQRYDPKSKQFVDIPFEEGSDGLAFSKFAFAKGAERIVFRCSEISGDGKHIGPKLVGKETCHNELMNDKNFHTIFCRVQGEAKILADLFNRRLRGPAESVVSFQECFVYTLKDKRYPGGVGKVLAEKELEGKFRKWNNNAGAVAAAKKALTIDAADSAQDEEILLSRVLPPAHLPLDAIHESGEQTDDDVDEVLPETGSAVEYSNDVPQCFSHFTYSVTEGKKLVCDLQGVWNKADGFLLTDPVIHYVSRHRRKHVNGKTDKGRDGVRRFFDSHQCNALCRRLGLKRPDIDDDDSE